MASSFTVVVPAFNAARLIGDTLEAIRRQTLPPQQVIVVDDGSTDGTGDLVRELFPEVSCVRVANSGAGLARRRAIDQCQSDWVALCDSDDVWQPDHLERKARLVEACPAAALLFADCYSFGKQAVEGHSLFSEAPAGWFERYTVDLQGDFFRLTDPYRAILAFNPAYPSGLAFRLDAYRRMGGFLPKYSRWIGEDSEFIRRFLALPDIVVAGDMAQTWGYRRHGGNTSATRWKNFHCKALVLQEHLDLAVVPTAHADEVRAEVRRALGEAFDIAFWDRSRRGTLELYGKLPLAEKTLKRRLKAVFARLIMAN